MRKNQPHRKLRRLETALYNWRIRDERKTNEAYIAEQSARRLAIEAHIRRLRPLVRASA